jgi:myo-inositol 2-dehydrogenase/D-chiro-inositol 1-dehydrogenase
VPAGTGGMADAANVPTNTVTVSTAKDVKNDLPSFFFIERYTESYINEMQHFIDSIKKDIQPSVSGIDGLEPVYIAKACMLSMKEKRAVKIEEVR